MARGRIHPSRTNRCEACLLLTDLCVCADCPRLEPTTRFVIIRHWKERWRPSNTGRLAALALPHTTLVDYGAPGEPWDDDTLVLSDPCLLFPDPEAPPLTHTPQTIVVIDASWSQARKMTRRVPGLAALPQLSLPPITEHPQRLRRPPFPQGMATLEAIARTLDHIEGGEHGAALDLFFSRFVDASLRSRGIRPR